MHSLADLAQVILYRVDQDPHVLGFAHRFVDHAVAAGCAFLLAFAAVGVVTCFALLAVDMPAFQADAVLDNLNAVVAGHCVHESL